MRHGSSRRWSHSSWPIRTPATIRSNSLRPVELKITPARSGCRTPSISLSPLGQRDDVQRSFVSPSNRFSRLPATRYLRRTRTDPTLREIAGAGRRRKGPRDQRSRSRILRRCRRLLSEDRSRHSRICSRPVARNRRPRYADKRNREPNPLQMSSSRKHNLLPDSKWVQQRLPLISSAPSLKLAVGADHRQGYARGKCRIAARSCRTIAMRTNSLAVVAYHWQ